MIEETETVDAKSCHDFCKTVPECLWFSFYSDYSICLALNNCTELNSEDYTVITFFSTAVAA